MAEENSIADRVRKIVCDVTGKTIDEVKTEATFEQLQADSLDVVEAIIGIEEEFDGVTIDDEAFNMSSTVGELIAAVEAANGQG